MLAMILYPEVQEKARQEIDSVIGRGRLPDFNDRGSLPYIEACVKEVLRWNPVAPLGQLIIIKLFICNARVLKSGLV
jgi:cytochrome P450